ncbi:MAG: 2'-5' RNA ligase family protein [Akkermansiaceae bacterium]|nr:2'-5' RNA ligase family protein [Armatimonadota bacterium]
MCHSLHGRLAAMFEEWLSAQDRQKFQPHVTIQNKVAPEAAKELRTRLSGEWEPITARGLGLHLWRYRNGPWETVATFPFTK